MPSAVAQHAREASPPLVVPRTQQQGLPLRHSFLTSSSSTDHFESCLSGLARTRTIQSEHDRLVDTLQRVLVRRRRSRSRSHRSPGGDGGGGNGSSGTMEAATRTTTAEDDMYSRQVFDLVERLFEGTAAVTENYRISVLDPLEYLTAAFRAYWKQCRRGNSRGRSSSSGSSNGAAQYPSRPAAYAIYPYSNNGRPEPKEERGKDADGDEGTHLASSDAAASPMRVAFERTTQLSAQLDELLHLQHEALLSIRRLLSLGRRGGGGGGGLEDKEEMTLAQYATQLSDLSGSTQHLLRCLEDELTSLCDPNPYGEEEEEGRSRMGSNGEAPRSCPRTTPTASATTVTSPVLLLREQTASQANASRLSRSLSAISTPSPLSTAKKQQRRGASGDPARTPPPSRSRGRSQSWEEPLPREKRSSTERGVLILEGDDDDGDNKENDSPRSSPMVVVSPLTEARRQQRHQQQQQPAPSPTWDATATFSRRLFPASPPKDAGDAAAVEGGRPSGEARALMPDLVRAASLREAILPPSSTTTEAWVGEAARVSQYSADTDRPASPCPDSTSNDGEADESGGEREGSASRSPRSPFADSATRTRMEESPPDEPPPQCTGSLRVACAGERPAGPHAYQTSYHLSSEGDDDDDGSASRSASEAATSDYTPSLATGSREDATDRDGDSDEEVEEGEEEPSAAIIQASPVPSQQTVSIPTTTTANRTAARTRHRQRSGESQQRMLKEKDKVIAKLQEQIVQLSSSNTSTTTTAPAGHQNTADRAATLPTDTAPAQVAHREPPPPSQQNESQDSWQWAACRTPFSSTPLLPPLSAPQSAAWPPASMPLGQQQFQQHWLYQQQQQYLQMLEEKQMRLLSELQAKVEQLKAEQAELKDRVRDHHHDHRHCRQQQQQQQQQRPAPSAKQQREYERSDSSAEEEEGENGARRLGKPGERGDNGDGDSVSLYHRRRQERQERRWRALVEELEGETQAVQDRLEEERARCARLQMDNIRLKKHLAETEQQLAQGTGHHGGGDADGVDHEYRTAVMRMLAHEQQMASRAKASSDSQTKASSRSTSTASTQREQPQVGRREEEGEVARLRPTQAQGAEAAFPLPHSSLSPLQRKRRELLHKLQSSPPAALQEDGGMDMGVPATPPQFRFLPGPSRGGSQDAPTPSSLLAPCALNETAVTVSPMSADGDGSRGQTTMGESPDNSSARGGYGNAAQRDHEGPGMAAGADSDGEDEEANSVSAAQQVILNAKRLLAKVRLADGRGIDQQGQPPTSFPPSLALSPPPPFPTPAQMPAMRERDAAHYDNDAGEAMGHDGTSLFHPQLWEQQQPMRAYHDTDQYNQRYHHSRLQALEPEQLGLSPCAAVSYSTSKQPRRHLPASPLSPDGIGADHHRAPTTASGAADPLFDPLTQQQRRAVAETVDVGTSPIRPSAPSFTAPMHPYPLTTTNTNSNNNGSTVVAGGPATHTRRERVVTIVTPGHTPQKADEPATQAPVHVQPILMSAPGRPLEGKKSSSSKDDDAATTTTITTHDGQMMLGSRGMAPHQEQPQRRRSSSASTSTSSRASTSTSSSREAYLTQLHAQFASLEVQQSDIAEKAAQLREKKRQLAQALGAERDELVKLGKGMAAEPPLPHQQQRQGAHRRRTTAKEDAPLAKAAFHRQRAQQLVMLMKKLQEAEQVLATKGAQTEESLTAVIRHMERLDHEL